MEARAAEMLEGQGEAPGLNLCQSHSRAADASSTVAMVHDTADTESDTEAATEPEGTSYAAENYVTDRPSFHRSVSGAISTVESGGGPTGQEVADDGISLLQGGVQSACAGGQHGRRGRQSFGPCGSAQGGAAGSTGSVLYAETQEISSSAPVPPRPGVTSLRRHTGERSANTVKPVAETIYGDDTSGMGGAPGVEAAALSGPLPAAESVGMAWPASSIGMESVNVDQPTAATPGFSLTSAPGPVRRRSRQPYGRSEAVSRPPAGLRHPGGPRQALSADGRAAGSTNAQIGSVGLGREAAAMSDSTPHSEDSQAGSRYPHDSSAFPKGPSTIGLSECAPPGMRRSLSATSFGVSQSVGNISLSAGPAQQFAATSRAPTHRRPQARPPAEQTTSSGNTQSHPRDTREASSNSAAAASGSTRPGGRSSKGDTDESSPGVGRATSDSNGNASGSVEGRTSEKFAAAGASRRGSNASSPQGNLPNIIPDDSPSPRLESEGQRHRPHKGGQQEQSARQQPARKKRKRQATPAEETAAAICDAARDGDAVRALAAYDAAIAANVSMRADSYSSVLYLCAGGDTWEARARGRADVGTLSGESYRQTTSSPMIEGPGTAARPAGTDKGKGPWQPDAGDYQMLFRRGREVLASMKERGLSIGESAYVALARMAASAGDGAAALEAAHCVAPSGGQPRLRSFAPALLAFATAGQVDEAFNVAAILGDLDIDLMEPEFEALLIASCHDSSWSRPASLLQRMSRELTTLSQSTLTAAKSLFASPAAATAFGPGGALSGQGTSWDVSSICIDDTGAVEGTSEKLSAFDLDDDEWAAFSTGIANLAQQKERKADDFLEFQRWLKQNGPFGVIIDGANVALYGQNFSEGGFDFQQIEAALEHSEKYHPDLKPLLLLHAGRTKGPRASHPRAVALLNSWRSSKTLYTTPFGSNDDWFWMYAAVHAGPSGLLISNDEMRDHLFQLLTPKYFKKWKDRHQIKYTFTAGPPLQAVYPAPYSEATQVLPSGTWMLPGVDGSWLAARPVRRTAAARQRHKRLDHTTAHVTTSHR